MSDFDMIRELRRNDERLRLTEVKETVRAPGFTSFYATGTWVPSFRGTTIAGTFTYSKQFGQYTRIGNQVFLYGSVQISAISVAPTGNMTIAGLPITAANLDAFYAAGVDWAYISQFNYTAAALDLTGYIRNNAATIELFESFDNGVGVAAPAANFTNANCYLTFSATYQI